MGREKRIVYPGLIYHVIKRGNNREVVFCEDEDYFHYLNCIKRYKKKYGFKLFAFCLMTNHVHMLIKVGESGSISKIMQSLTVAHIKYYNFKYQRTGHVWQGRFRSPIVSNDEYLINTMQYIERNPIRARMVKAVGDYRWSSYKLNCMSIREGSKLLDREENSVFAMLGKDDKERISKYKEMIAEGLTGEEINTIRKSTKFGTPYVSARYKDHISKMFGLKSKRGRPAKNKT